MSERKLRKKLKDIIVGQFKKNICYRIKGLMSMIDLFKLKNGNSYKMIFPKGKS